MPPDKNVEGSELDPSAAVYRNTSSSGAITKENQALQKLITFFLSCVLHYCAFSEQRAYKGKTGRSSVQVLMLSS
jgi:hypothetical protein